MNLTSRMIWTLGGMCLISSLFGEEKQSAYASPSPSFGKAAAADTNRRLEIAERKIDQISEEKASDGLGSRQVPALGLMGGEEGMFTHLSFLYWKAYNHGFPFALTVGPSTRSKLHEVKFHTEPGVRLGLGYTSRYDAWNVQGIWTWIRFSGKRHISADPGATLILNPVFSPLDLHLGSGYGNAGGFWKLNHNLGDLQFGRGFFITKAVALQPLLGVRVAVFDQSARTFFENSLSPASASLLVQYKPHNSYWGLGPRLGIDSKWTLPYNIGFTGLVTGSALYGKMKQSLIWKATPVALSEPLEIVNRRDTNYYTVVPNVQLALGLDWGMSFDKDRIYFGLNLGWELNYYWWQNAGVDLGRELHFPLEIQGLTLRTDLHF